jgi:mannose-6-phosphate isomerase-like protein (cupin superfamily)
MAAQDIQETPEQIARHEEAERRMLGYSYARPESLGEANKGLVRLAGTDLMRGVVQVIENGGENVLHYHEGMDSFWMVLRGRARFYGPGDKLIGEYGPFEGVVTPRGARYWFEKASDDETLELLQVARPRATGTNGSMARTTTNRSTTGDIRTTGCRRRTFRRRHRRDRRVER